ncbi:MAG: NADH-quinone oxidoreductase subunit L [Alphaproteobacteria bacterium]|nr:NADH-quinone oxidoreductase subunit L [Alphaproteobacteria bacterium]
MLYELIVFFPLAGAIIAGLFGRYMGKHGAEYLATFFLCVSAVFSLWAFYEVALQHHTETVHLFSFLDSGELQVDWALRIDTLTAVMLVVVTVVSSLVHVYSIGYMEHDEHRPRFFSYLSLFTFAMLALVTSDNFVQMFFGWEGVGLASYLLIGFWYTRPSANAAAIKAFVVNRVGDFGFALGLMAIFFVFRSLDFTTVFEAAGSKAGQTFNFAGYDVDILTTICLLLFMGAMGKSAQFMLHTWLPDAMEGPTPVSALIHAATMVTAGVFLVCRCSPLFELAPTALAFVTIIGATTAFFAATVGLFQNDIKRVIAYSTCSQLGYMFAAAGVSAYQAAMFHLFTHAFFKALLFLGAGAVIHALHDEQDMRKMGALYKIIPWTYILMCVGTLSLTGFPVFFSGFWSKDAIIESTLAAHSTVGTYAFVLLVIAAGMTSFYSWRLIFMTFHGRYKGDNVHDLDHAHDAPTVMWIPLMILAAGAVIAGWPLFANYFGHFITEEHVAFWHGAIAQLPAHNALEAREAIPEWAKFSPTVMMLLGYIIAWYYYIDHPELPAKLAARRGPLYLFLYNKWYFDELYDLIFVRPAKWIGRQLWKLGDGKIIDGIGPDGVAAGVVDWTRQVVKLQSGYVYHYAFAMLLGVVIFVTYFVGGFGQ